MPENAVFSLAAVVVLGVAAQWLAWRLQLPSILLLLLVGFIVGPVLGFIEPDVLLGDLLQPIVALGVAVILFEGGLTLKFADLRGHGSVVPLLITAGLVITWAVATGVSYFVLDLDLRVAVLLGAVLVVSGPTVVGPLLRQVRPIGGTGPILKWEGILIDPIGATLALVVFEVVLALQVGESVGHARLVLLWTLLVGGGFGIAGAGLLVLMLRRFWIPDYLQAPVTLMMVFAIFAAANYIQDESGLLAVTVAGVAMANQQFVSVRHILEFKENLTILLLSGLFVLLAARLGLDDIRSAGLSSLALLAALVLVARPLGVAISTFRSRLAWRERLFLGWMYPRGIVAAAVSALFALRLQEAGVPQSGRLVSLTFTVIVGTVVIYGLTAMPLAKRLGLARPNPQGFLIVGAHRWARRIAQALESKSRPVLLVDTDKENVAAAQAEGFRAVQVNILSERARDELELSGIGYLLALTSNDELNSLASVHFAEVFGSAGVYQLPPQLAGEDPHGVLPRHLRGRLLFDRKATHSFLSDQINKGGFIDKVEFTKAFGYEVYRARYKGTMLPLFGIDEKGNVIVATARQRVRPRAGQTLVALVNPVDTGSDFEKADESPDSH